MSSADFQRRVVVTGLGAVTPVGISVGSYWESLVSGRCGIKRISSFDTDGYPCRIGGEISEFDATRWMEPKEARRNDRYTQLAFAATMLALEDATMDTANLDADRIGVFIGSGVGGIATTEDQAAVLRERGPRRVSPFAIPSLIANIGSATVAIAVGARGPNFAIVSACASSAHSIGEALKAIRFGEADVMIAGGSEAGITPLGFAAFSAMKAMSTRNDEPEKASRPFDIARDGFVMGEGAGVLILETLEHARTRGARIYCELAGYGSSCDAFHITQPDPEGRGLFNSMKRALETAGVTAGDVDYINAHGTSTPYNDKFETASIKRLFGEHAHELKISSTKSMTGHLLGGAGAIEAIASVKSIETGTVPPTINLDNPDPDCDLDYVPHVAQQVNPRVVLSNNLGFGGQNASLVFRAVD